MTTQFIEHVEAAGTVVVLVWTKAMLIRHYWRLWKKDKDPESPKENTKFLRRRTTPRRPARRGVRR